jgi:hypothetical protein
MKIFKTQECLRKELLWVDNMKFNSLSGAKHNWEYFRDSVLAYPNIYITYNLNFT